MKNIDAEIDKYLNKLYCARDHTMFASDLYDDFMYNVPHAIDRAMIGRDLIEVEKEVRILTEFGIRIGNQGGWNQFLLNEASTRQKVAQTENEIQALTKKQLELSIREMHLNFTQIRYWWLILILTTIASAVLGAWLQSLFN